MKLRQIIIILYLITTASCGQSQQKRTTMNTTKYQFTNHLIHQTSPYLLQHAHNPVNWYPWGEQALDKAKKENKLLIISIGYSACHWCHVMEHESFEDEQVAKLMNENFVSIKVDREERPDIDQIYMNAVQLITGSGGWPLNCIALPDGRPIYGGTYYNKEQWIDMLSQILDFTKQNPEKTEKQAVALTRGIQSNEINFNSTHFDYTVEDLDNIFNNWEKNIDDVNGGTIGAPKFPMPIGYQFLMFYNYLTKNSDALKTVELTLTKMANGGIYDQIGGGFARYSVDSQWRVPHFEKMLYDNAQLISLYSYAYQYLQNDKFKDIVIETLEFVKRELTSNKFGFYSSLDADSENQEGKYYVWTKNQIINILGDNANLFIDYYNVNDKGNWENSNNILQHLSNDKNIIEQYNITEIELQKQLEASKKLLLNYREKRVKPALDDKILTSWNALMLKAYVDAYKVFKKPEYLEIAIKNAEFINANLKSSDGKLYRSYKNSQPSINGYLDDYAFVISSFISLYQATFNEKWLNEANQLTKYTLIHFFNKENGMFYYTSDIDNSLIARKMEINDNVIPSSNSEMAKNLFMLGHYYSDDNYIRISKQMLDNVKNRTSTGNEYFANWDILMGWFVKSPFDVAIIGDKFENIRSEFENYYLPNVFLSGGKTEGSLAIHKDKYKKGKTNIYVCVNKVCKFPVDNINKALKQIQNKQ